MSQLEWADMVLKYSKRKYKHFLSHYWSRKTYFLFSIIATHYCFIINKVLNLKKSKCKYKTKLKKLQNVS